MASSTLLLPAPFPPTKTFTPGPGATSSASWQRKSRSWSQVRSMAAYRRTGISR